jgi:hypothetical protein
MKSLFDIRPSNAHAMLISPDYPEWANATASLNQASISCDGFPLPLVFHELNKSTVNRPDITTVYIGGALAFRAALKESLFPFASPALQFLPITVEGEAWCLLNCLQAASGIDRARSEFLDGLNGEIYFVMKVWVTDPEAHDWEVFTLQEANRGQLFADETFRDRVEKLGLEGITFAPIGGLV